MVLIGGLILLVTYLMTVTYSAYTKLVLQERQENLLVVSRAVSRNLQSFFTEQIQKMDILTQTPGFQDQFSGYYENGDATVMKEYIFSYMLSHQQGLASIYVLDREGNPIFHYDQYPFIGLYDGANLNLSQYRDARKSGIGELLGISGGKYGVTLVNNVYGGQGYLGTVVSIMDMNEIYRQYVQPLSPDGDGYIMVKDENGTVIMHPVDRMLRFNYERDLEGLRSLPQYEDLRNMLDLQYGQEEGSAIYMDYTKGIVPPEQLVTSFTRMNVNGVSWYVSANMPYQEALHTETDSLRHFAMLNIAIVVLFLAGGLVIYGQQRERQKLKMETRYLRDMNRTLEELHQSQEQIRHYQKLTTIGMLAGGIVHEFNNLLTPIMGYSEFLMERLGKENEYYGDIEEIYKAGERGKEIVKQILPFSRKEMETSVFAPVNIDAVAEDALKAIALLKPSDVEIREQLGAAGVNVYGSATQIHQVLLNLLSNSCQAMEETGGVLTVETKRIVRDEIPGAYREVADTDYVEIIISDTGCGMSRETLRQIFEPFFTTKGKGTGLGLSVVKNIMVNHGGFVLADSEPGKGSRFQLYFPATELAVPGAEGEQEKRRRPGKGSVLLVDDDSQVVRYLRKRLTLKGYRVEAYTDAKTVMELLGRRNGSWQVMIVDDTMPQYRGIALARKARQREGMGIILITGLVGQDTLLMKEEGIIDEIMVKPIRFKELLNLIERMAAEKKGEKQ